ncbi:MAG: LTA synthase family protein [Desulfosalsimonadaceae bacterium]|nr:LTA synthase family protein [Desulfosalsimonadaceae bacterium]
MFFNVKKITGPFYPFLVFLLTAVTLLFLSRLGLSLWQFDRVSAANGWIPVLLQGLRVDVATIIMMVGVIALFSTFLSGPGVIGRVWNKAAQAWLTLALMLLVFMELATPQFIIEYGFRPNRLFVEFLSYPKEVFSMLSRGHLPEMVICLAGLGLSFWAGWRLFGKAFQGIVYPGPGRRTLMALLILVPGFLGARSTLGHRPLNPAMVAFADDALVNSLPLNSFYSVAHGINQMVKEADSSKIYGRMAKEDILRIVRKETGLPESAFTNPNFPTLHHQTAAHRGKPKNLVIILEESLGARYVGSLGGLPLTPNLDALAQKGWLFERLYATGTRSVRGIEAVISGFTPTPALSVVKLGKSQHDFFTLADLLRRRGYFCEFIYGGESHFDNMRSFFLGNGFHHVIEQKDYENPEFVASWGVSDEDLLNRAHQEFSERHSKGQPFFALVFSSTNHDPFDFPKGRIELYDQPMQTRNNAAKYADYAIGRFFEQAEKSSYWEDTVFLVVADHDSRVTGADLVPVSHFRIPGVIVGAGIPHKRDVRLVSQIDLPPTLLSLMGVDNENPMLGRDMTRQPEDYTGRAMMQYDTTFAYMEGDQVMILQPHKEAQGFVCAPETQTLSRHVLSDDLAEKALAHVLWGSMAYQEQLYRLPGNDG